MNLPHSIAENALYFWIVLGIVLVLSGLFIFKRRLGQKQRKVRSTHDEYLDQTMELNLRELPPSARPTPADYRAPE